MYIYFNNQGTLTTNIPHGEPVRQGNILNVYACLPINFYSSKQEDKDNWYAEITTVLPNNNQGVNSLLSLTESNNLMKLFRKTNDSEITYDLKDNAPYLIYHFKLTSEQATIVPGKLQLKIKLKKISSTDFINLGAVTVFVEKVLGDHEQKGNPYGDLIRQVRDISAEVLLKENKSNKINSWSSTPSEEKYPSESLIKNYVDISDQEYSLSPQEAYNRLKGYIQVNDGNNTYFPQAAYDRLKLAIETTEEIWYEPTTEPNIERYKTWVSGVEINFEEEPSIISSVLQTQPVGDILIDENQPDEVLDVPVERNDEPTQPVGDIIIDENQPV